MLFYGPPGVGKWSAAESFIRQSLCAVGSACGHCSSCRKLEHNNHADFIRFPVNKVAIGDSQNPEPFTVRWLQQTRLPYAPFDGALRFVLFPRGDLILHEAETALLKTLEEPPDHTRFIMLTTSLSDVRPTIVSRAIAVPFGLLSQQTLRQLSGADREEELLVLGGSLHWAPLFTTQFYQYLIEAIPKALLHIQDLLELEQWLLSAEQKNFSNYIGEENFLPEELFDFFVLLFLALTEKHVARAKLAAALFTFKSGLHLGMVGLLPYLLARFFCNLQAVLFPNGRS